MRTLPAEILDAREPVLAKALSHLPDELLSALALGLERHSGRLVAGRLYGEHDGGGCAVGVMLRELSPATYREGRLQFWLRRRRHQSIVTERVELERPLVTRLSHVEMCFDRTAGMLCGHVPGGDAGVAANLTGRWMAEACRQQLRARSRAGRVGFFVPEHWQVPSRLISTQRRAAGAARAATRRLTAHAGVRQLMLHDGRVMPVPVRTGLAAAEGPRLALASL